MAVSDRIIRMIRLLLAVSCLTILPSVAGDFGSNALARESPILIGSDTEGDLKRVEGGEIDIGVDLPLYSVGPFLGILLSIALLPLVLPRFWHRYFPLISAFWSLTFAIPFLCLYGGAALHEILHIYFLDYIPFIILLWGLFTISGGILIEGRLKGSPVVNSAILLLGTVIASWIGTTGASMLLIRPLIKANAWRERRIHIVVFFIFLVSNVGGALTPLGDPPLFLGFLHGVPFHWTFRLLPEMALISTLLLFIFFLMDTYYYRKDMKAERKEEQADEEEAPIRIRGLHNVFFLLGVVGAVLFSGLCRLGHVHLAGLHIAVESMIRDVFIILMGLGSYLVTSNKIRERNSFSWFPIKEVAYLFAGIFITIIPALAILKSGQHGNLGFIVEKVKEPWHYFWMTGLLSSFLDNAPTYLTFLNSALGTFYAQATELEAVHRLIQEQEVYLKAISLGAVFMGANTYIGNAPNFMVKSIAEQYGIPMPSFFGYIFKYSLPILIPMFIVGTLAFFV